MPLPTPKKGEERKEFTSRCMGNEIMIKEFPNPDQRYAVCNSKYKDERTAELTEEILKKTSVSK